MAMAPPIALPYHEPDIITILKQSSFLIALNVINNVLDRLIYCGLLGQIFIGVAWGTPSAHWLNAAFQEAAVSLGYLGLILLVYDGGLSTSLASLRANIVLSTAVALTGIAMPIAFSFSLRALISATPLQAFAAGAALCSTSLGTTFTVLNTSGLTRTKLGTVLTSAAMMDDVVGLVLVQVISNIGSSSSFSSVTVVRPIAVSFGLVIVLFLCCRYLVLPGTRVLRDNWHLESWKSLMVSKYSNGIAFLTHTTILLGLVAGATYAGTSGLFAAYLAGTTISWWDSEFLDFNGPDMEEQNTTTTENHARDPPQPEEISKSTTEGSGRKGGSGSQGDGSGNATSVPISEGPADAGSNSPSQTQLPPTGLVTYERYYSAVVDRILKPLFFASIGFAIPITKMFQGNIIWRGLVYTILMLLGKFLTGLWLIRFDFTTPRILRLVNSLPVSRLWCRGFSGAKEKQGGHNTNEERTNETVTQQQSQPEATSSHSLRWPRPRSLYPASILGSAMVARGEIGFLISSLAESKGIFASASLGKSDVHAEGASEIYLVITWAIMLCTIIGPVGIGLLVKRVKRLKRRRDSGGGSGGGQEDPLGIWGVL